MLGGIFDGAEGVGWRGGGGMKQREKTEERPAGTMLVCVGGDIRWGRGGGSGGGVEGGMKQREQIEEGSAGTMLLCVGGIFDGAEGVGWGGGGYEAERTDRRRVCRDNACVCWRGGGGIPRMVKMMVTIKIMMHLQKG